MSEENQTTALATQQTSPPGSLSKRKNGKGKLNNPGGLDEAVGGRDVLIRILEWAPKTAKLEHALNLMADPMRATTGLAKICEDSGLSQREFLSAFREASVAKALAEAHIAMADKLQDVAEDVAEKAINHVEWCKCTVGGTVDPAKDCPDCRGVGKVYYRGSLPHQNLVFESTGLLKRGGGVNVNVQQQVAVSGESLFDKFVKATDRAAYGTRIVEGEATVVEEVKRDENPEDSGTTHEVQTDA